MGPALRTSSQSFIASITITIKSDAPPRRANPNCETSLRKWVRCSVTKPPIQIDQEGRTWWQTPAENDRLDYRISLLWYTETQSGRVKMRGKFSRSDKSRSIELRCLPKNGEDRKKHRRLAHVHLHTTPTTCPCARRNSCP